MAKALIIGAVTAALLLAFSAAFAGNAPAAYYPSLGYGQTEPFYDDGPTLDEAPYDEGYDDERYDRSRDDGYARSYGDEAYEQEDLDVALPTTFFADAGGVGPAYLGGGSSGWRVFIQDSGSSRAFAFASARASVRSFSHSCGCRR